MVHIINIKPEHIRILPFLFPTYSIISDFSKLNRFIAVKDINSKRELDDFDFYHEDCVVVSTRLYREFWDEDKLKELAINFARVNFKCRKRLLTEIDNERPDFVDALISFMFTGEIDTISEEEIMDLFHLLIS